MRVLRLTVTPEAFAMLQEHYHTQELVELDILEPVQLQALARVTAIDPLTLAVELTVFADPMQAPTLEAGVTIEPPEPHPNCRCELPPTLFGYPVKAMPTPPALRPPRVLVDLLDMPEPDRRALIEALRGSE